MDVSAPPPASAGPEPPPPPSIRPERETWFTFLRRMRVGLACLRSIFFFYSQHPRAPLPILRGTLSAVSLSVAPSFPLRAALLDLVFHLVPWTLSSALISQTYERFNRRVASMTRFERDRWNFEWKHYSEKCFMYHGKVVELIFTLEKFVFRSPLFVQNNFL